MVTPSNISPPFRTLQECKEHRFWEEPLSIAYSMEHPLPTSAGTME